MHPSKWQYFVESLCAPLSLEEAGDPQYWALNAPTEESLWLALREACAAPHYWMRSEPRPFDMDSDVVAMVRSVTEDSEIMAWWRAPIDRNNQRSVEWIDDHPSLNAPQVERTSLEQWVRRASTESGNGPWWSAPLPPTAIHTSRATTFAPAVHLIADEDDHGFDHTRIHVLSPLSTRTRIYEIASRDDWVALVDSAPVDVSRSRDENWGNRAPTYRPFPLPPRQSELPQTHLVDSQLGDHRRTLRWRPPHDQRLPATGRYSHRDGNRKHDDRRVGSRRNGLAERSRGERRVDARLRTARRHHLVFGDEEPAVVASLEWCFHR